MASPFWKYPSVLNGRIGPQNADAQDLGSGYTGIYYYGAWYFYTYVSSAYSSYEYTYTYEAGHVFCLGEDQAPLYDYRLADVDASEVYQAAVDLTGVDVIYFTWRLNTHEDMPEPVSILSNGLCTFSVGGVLTDGATTPQPVVDLKTILLPAGASPLFQTSYYDRLLVVSGATDAANNGTFRISGVPSSQGNVAAVPTVTQIQNGRLAIIENAAMVARVDDPNVTLTLLGCRWVARAYVDGTLRCVLTERAGRSWQRNNLAMHTSKLAGNHQLRFELKLEATTS